MKKLTNFWIEILNFVQTMFASIHKLCKEKMIYLLPVGVLLVATGSVVLLALGPVVFGRVGSVTSVACGRVGSVTSVVFGVVVGPDDF